MSTYNAPQKDMRFIVKNLLGLDSIRALPGYEDCSDELFDSVIEEGSKFAANVLDPLNRVGDKEGAKFENGNVFSPTGFKEAFKQFSESGWVSLGNDPKWGGQGLPHVISSQMSEMWNSACMSFCLCPMLTAGAVMSLSRHGSPEQQEKYLRKLIDGTWSGTMQLTEPQAGSDLSAIRTKAVPEGDHFLISGTKIYITWGEHDMVDNIIHMVLAKTPGSPDGVKGISLFIVPKFHVNDDGSLGEKNDVSCVSIEHKLGIHGSPTCVMSYGDNGGAVGYLVGEENRGLEYMFTMMNFARIEVGIEGVAMAERAYQHAREYALSRVQGRKLGDKSGDRVAIVHHPDVRRMLLTMRVKTEAMRALATFANFHLDHALKNPDEKIKNESQSIFDLLTPVVKAWCTEESVEIASTGIQVHGGMGFIEETGAAQYLRDARITPIYEGTTAIQANDLIGRKIIFEGGSTLKKLMSMIEATIEDNNSDDTIAKNFRQNLEDSLNDLNDVTSWAFESYKKDPLLPYASSVHIIELIGLVVSGWLMFRSLIVSSDMLKKSDDPFYQHKIDSCLFFSTNLLTKTQSLKRLIIEGSEAIILPKVSNL
mgnify:CR=1 FL=1